MTKARPADWLRLAADDMVVAQEAHKKGIYHLSCFHAQQAAEKLLKTYLAHQDKVIPKIHSLVELYTLVVSALPGLEQYKESLKILDKYYVPTRYPDAVPGSLPEGLPTAVDAREAIGDVEQLRRFIEGVVLKSGQKE